MTPVDATQTKKSDVASLTTDEYYEDKGILTSYDQFHFGAGLLGVKNFPLRMSEVCIEACRKYGTEMNGALDAGCGPGRTAVELCQAFDKVGIFIFLTILHVRDRLICGKF